MQTQSVMAEHWLWVIFSEAAGTGCYVMGRNICRHNIEFWGFWGTPAPALNKKALWWDLSKFCVVYVKFHTNDLCDSRSAALVRPVSPTSGKQTSKDYSG